MIDEELVEIPQEPTHSLVPVGYEELKPNEAPVEFAYKGTQYWMLRRIVEDAFITGTLAEARELIAYNIPVTEEA